MTERKLLFSLGPKDFRVDTFRSGGKGGQHQNTTDSGVRITHLASGAVGESREERSQLQNKKNAMRRLTETPTFKKWHKIHCAELMGQHVTIEQEVAKALTQPIKVEVKHNGLWQEVGGISELNP